MHNNRYSLEFKEHVFAKVRGRGSRTLKAIARDVNVPLPTLKGWLATESLRAAVPHAAQLPAANLPANQWSPAQRLLALQQTYALADDDLHAWCRESGLFAHQLTQWRADFLAPPTGSHNTSPDTTKTALNQLKTQHTKLQKELLRKERALAEAAALLVLQGKLQALLEDEV
jgi:hypothetical protein